MHDRIEEKVARSATIVVAVGMLVAIPERGAAESDGCPVDGPLSSQTITRAARQAFERGPGRLRAERVAGLERADDAVPSRIRRVSGSVAPELRADGDQATNEYTAAVNLHVRLGRLAGAEREAWRARTDAERARLAEQRAAYVFRVQRAYVDWWTAGVERRHLKAYQRAFEEDAQALKKGVDEQRVTSLEMADLEVEIGRIESRRIDAEKRMASARASLRELLGGACELKSATNKLGSADPLARRPSPDWLEANPWKPLLERVDQFPEVRRVVAERERARKERLLAERRAGSELAAGIGSRSVGMSDYWIVPQMSLSVPLVNPAAPEAEKHSAVARGLAAEREWVVRRVRADIRAASSRWRAAVGARGDYVDAYVEPLRERSELFEKALQQGRIALKRVIRARRELHEAEHELLAKDADLLGRRLRARALREMIATRR